MHLDKRMFRMSQNIFEYNKIYFFFFILLRAKHKGIMHTKYQTDNAKKYNTFCSHLLFDT